MDPIVAKHYARQGITPLSGDTVVVDSRSGRLISGGAIFAAGQDPARKLNAFTEGNGCGRPFREIPASQAGPYLRKGKF